MVATRAAKRVKVIPAPRGTASCGGESPLRPGRAGSPDSGGTDSGPAASSSDSSCSTGSTGSDAAAAEAGPVSRGDVLADLRALRGDIAGYLEDGLRGLLQAVCEDRDAREPQDRLERSVQALHAAVTSARQEDADLTRMLFDALRRERDATRKAEDADKRWREERAARAAAKAEAAALRLSASEMRAMHAEALRRRDDGAAPAHAAGVASVGSLAAKYVIERFLTERYDTNAGKFMRLDQAEAEFCRRLDAGEVELPRGYRVRPGGRGAASLKAYLGMSVVWTVNASPDGELLCPMYLCRK